MPPVSGGRPGRRAVCNASSVPARASIGGPAVGTPTGASPSQTASPPASVRIAWDRAPTIEYRDQTPPCSALSRRNVPGASAASLRYSPSGVSASASSRRTTGITLRSRASSRNAGRSGQSHRAPAVARWSRGRPGRRAEVASLEAGAGAGVAGGPDLVDADQHRVAVAVEGDRAHVLHVARGVALD